MVRIQLEKLSSEFCAQISVIIPLNILTFNTFPCDLFHMMSDTDFASYADNNTPYVPPDTIDEVVTRLETASVKLFKWFTDNQMKANQYKRHLII